MIVDCYSGQHSCGDAPAIRAYEQAVHAFLAHRPALPHLQQALALEPSLPAAHALTGLAHALIGRDHGMMASRAALAATGRALDLAGGGTAYEKALALVHALAAAGHLQEAAGVLEKHLGSHPTDALSIKAAHGLRFMSGNTARMLATTSAVLPHWSATTPGYGFMLGCRAFALEEAGRLTEAEAVGHRALAQEADDVWALHAVAHVMEMGGRTREGRALLAPSRQSWQGCGGFGQHILWHLALFHLSEGDSEQALALFDDGMAPARDGDFRDVANAVSLLWRLEQEGIEVGGRWQIVREIAHERRRDCTYAFASLHYLLALIASGDDRGAAELVTAMRERSVNGRCDQSGVISIIALELAPALVAASRRGLYRPRSEELARRLPLLGGSRAQRDVFLRTLMSWAAASNDAEGLAALGSMRRHERSEDRFQSIVMQRCKRKGTRDGGRSAAVFAELAG